MIFNENHILPMRNSNSLKQTIWIRVFDMNFHQFSMIFIKCFKISTQSPWNAKISDRSCSALRNSQATQVCSNESLIPAKCTIHSLEKMNTLIFQKIEKSIAMYYILLVYVNRVRAQRRNYSRAKGSTSHVTFRDGAAKF